MLNLMKRASILLLLLLCAAFPALAEEAPEAAALALVEAKYPGCAIARADQYGDTAAAALTHDGRNILCIMEKRDGEWGMAVDSDAILPEGEGMLIGFCLDTEETLFWTYIDLNDNSSCFHASRLLDGAWAFSDEVMTKEVHLPDGRKGLHETTLARNGDAYSHWILTKALYDEQENFISQEEPLYLPALQSADAMDLRTFGIREFPRLMAIEYPGEWPDRAYLEAAASLLIPGCVYRGGALSGDSLQLLVDKPDGARVLAVLDLKDGETLVESQPLPPDTYYGVENFTTSLSVNGFCVTIENYAPYVPYGISYLNGYTSHAQFLRLGPMVIADNETSPNKLYFGRHPWQDIRGIDWDALPVTLEEAARSIDVTGYALVDNPDPKDRLHLRELPDRKSRSLGKYYSGTPVYVSSIRGDWAEVVVLDSGFVQVGWMMKKYLKFSDRLVIDLGIMPDWTFRPGAMLYGAPNKNAVQQPTDSFDPWQIVGIIGDEWFHVWNPWTGEAGFAHVSDELPGNG